EAARSAHDKDVVVHVLGVGRPDGAPIPIGGTMSFLKDKDGNVGVPKLNEEMCQEIASNGKGLDVRVDNTNTAFRSVSNELDKMAKSEISTTAYANYNERFQSFAILALLLLLIDFFVFERVNKRFSRLQIFDMKEKI